MCMYKIIRKDRMTNDDCAIQDLAVMEKAVLRCVDVDMLTSCRVVRSTGRRVDICTG